MSGILAGIRLKQAGVPFVIIEKNADVGGTWFENTYPGARVDVPNAFYSYSFAQKTDWPKYFSPQDVLLDYFRDCADEYGLREHIRFSTEVVSATFDDERCAWTLRLRTPDGGEETIEAQARDQRRRPAQPPEDAGHRRAWRRSPGRRSTRRAGTTASTSRASASP